MGRYPACPDLLTASRQNLSQATPDAPAQGSRPWRGAQPPEDLYRHDEDGNQHQCHRDWMDDGDGPAQPATIHEPRKEEERPKHSADQQQSQAGGAYVHEQGVEDRIEIERDALNNHVDCQRDREDEKSGGQYQEPPSRDHLLGQLGVLGPGSRLLRGHRQDDAQSDRPTRVGEDEKKDGVPPTPASG